jgi:hypothetical protein
MFVNSRTVENGQGDINCEMKGKQPPASPRTAFIKTRVLHFFGLSISSNNPIGPLFYSGDAIKRHFGFPAPTENVRKEQQSVSGLCPLCAYFIVFQC